MSALQALGAGIGAGMVIGSLMLVADHAYSQLMGRVDEQRPDRDAEIGVRR